MSDKIEIESEDALEVGQRLAASLIKASNFKVEIEDGALMDPDSNWGVELEELGRMAIAAVNAKTGA